MVNFDFDWLGISVTYNKEYHLERTASYANWIRKHPNTDLFWQASLNNLSRSFPPHKRIVYAAGCSPLLGLHLTMPQAGMIEP